MSISFYFAQYKINDKNTMIASVIPILMFSIAIGTFIKWIEFILEYNIAINTIHKYKYIYIYQSDSKFLNS